METKSTAGELQRIQRIADGKIPVSEESSVFKFFFRRKEIAKVFFKLQSDNNQEILLEEIRYIEDKIKEYLCL